MIHLGTAVAELILDKRGFKDSLASVKTDIKGLLKNKIGIGDNLKRVGKSISGLGNTLTKNVTMPIFGAGAACVKLAATFETSMAKVQTIAKASKVELASMRKEILKSSSQVGMSAKDYAEATYTAISSGIDKSDAVAFTKDAAKLAKGGFTDVNTAVDVLTTTMNAYGKSVKDVKDISNQLIITQNLGKTTVDNLGSSLGNIIPTASSAGMKTQELFSSIAVATAQGQKTAESITGIKAALSNIISPSERASKAAETLGLKFDIASMKSKGWMPFLQDVKSKLESSAPAYSNCLKEVNSLKVALSEQEQIKKNSKETKEKNKELIEQEKEKIAELREQKRKLTKVSKKSKGAYDEEIVALQNHIDEMSEDRKSNKIAIRETREQIKLLREKNKATKESTDNSKGEKDSIDDQINAIQKHIKELRREGKASGYSAEKTRDLKKALSEKEKDLKVLGKTSGDTLSAFSVLFGSVEGLNSVMALTSESGGKLYNKSLKEMKTNTNAAEEAYKTMMDTPEEKFKKAKIQLENIGITIGGYLLPHVVKFLDTFSKVLECISKLPDPIKKSIIDVLGFVALAGPILKLSGSFITLGGSVLTTIGRVKNIKKIPSILASIVSGVTSKTKLIGNSMFLLPKTIGKASSGVVKIVKLMKNGILGAFSGIGNCVGTLIKTFSSIPALLSPHTLLIIAAIAGIGLCVYQVIRHWGALKSGAKKIFSETGRIIKTSIRGWGMMFEDLYSKAKKWGSNLVEGFTGGIKKKFNTVKDGICSLTDGVKSLFKGNLEIHSPSHFTDRCGQYWNHGLVNGLAKTKENVFDKVKSITGGMRRLCDLKGSFKGIDSDFSNFNDPSRLISSQKINKQYTFNPNIVMHVAISDTGAKGTEELTGELRGVAINSIKNLSTELFMNDAIRD